MFQERQSSSHSEESPGLSSVQMYVLRAKEKLQSLEDKMPDCEALVQQGEELLKAFPDLQGAEDVVAGVSLDSRISPAEQVERFFEIVRNSREQADWIAETSAVLRELEHRMELGEVIKKADVPGIRFKPQILPRSSFRSILSSDEQFILVGKGGARNDHLTLEVAQEHHTFLHVKGLTGAHVILPYASHEITDCTMRQACQLALHYSKAREQASVQMSIARCCDIIKEPGAPDGRVTLLNQKVVSVERDPSTLAIAMSRPRNCPFPQV